MTLISIELRYKSIKIGGLYRLILIILTDFLYRFLSINYCTPEMTVQNYLNDNCDKTQIEMHSYF